MKDDVDIKGKVKIFKVLGNERRLQILKLLLKNKELSVSEIAQNINLSFKSTSKHLQRLETVGFIKRNQHSFWGYYKVNPKFSNKFLEKTMIFLNKNVF